MHGCAYCELVLTSDFESFSQVFFMNTNATLHEYTRNKNAFTKQLLFNVSWQDEKKKKKKKEKEKKKKKDKEKEYIHDSVVVSQAGRWSTLFHDDSLFVISALQRPLDEPEISIKSNG